MRLMLGTIALLFVLGTTAYAADGVVDMGNTLTTAVCMGTGAAGQGDCNSCKPKCDSACKPKCDSACKPKCDNACKPKCDSACKPKCDNACKPKCDNACKPKCDNACKPKCDTCKPEAKCGKCDKKSTCSKCGSAKCGGGNSHSSPDRDWYTL